MYVIKARVDDAQTVQELKDAKRDIRKKAKEGLTEAGRRAVLPRVKAGAPSVVRNYLTTRATSTRGYVTFAGPRKFDRIGGLLNYGGTVKTVIRPTHKKALSLGNLNIVRASVTGPRRYTGSHYIEKGVERSLPELERQMLPTLMDAFDPLQHQP